MYVGENYEKAYKESKTKMQQTETTYYSKKDCPSQEAQTNTKRCNIKTQDITQDSKNEETSTQGYQKN